MILAPLKRKSFLKGIIPLLLILFPLLVFSQAKDKKKNFYLIQSMVNDTLVTDTCYPRTKEEIASYVNGKLNRIEAIYDVRLLQGARPKGKIEFEIGVSYTGGVTQADIKYNVTKDTVLANRVRAEILKWDFGSIGCPGDFVSIHYPFVFELPDPSEYEEKPKFREFYYDNGNLMEKFSIVNDTIIEIRNWYPNGQLHNILYGNYKHRYLEGTKKEFYDNGTLAYEHLFKAGKPHGNFKGWRKNGKLLYNANFKDSVLQNIDVFVYDKTENLYMIMFYNRNVNTGYTLYYPNGQKQAEIINSEKDESGLILSWYIDGKERRKAPILKEKEHGAYCEWHENGNIALKCNFKNGKKDGKEQKWDETGKLLLTRKYKLDKLISEEINK